MRIATHSKGRPAGERQPYSNGRGEPALQAGRVAGPLGERTMAPFPQFPPVDIWFVRAPSRPSRTWCKIPLLFSPRVARIFTDECLAPIRVAPRHPRRIDLISQESAEGAEKSQAAILRGSRGCPRRINSGISVPSYYNPSGSSLLCKVSLYNAVVQCSQSAAVGPALVAGPLCVRTKARRPAAALHSSMLPSALGSVAAGPRRDYP